MTIDTKFGIKYALTYRLYSSIGLALGDGTAPAVINTYSCLIVRKEARYGR